MFPTRWSLSGGSGIGSVGCFYFNLAKLSYPVVKSRNLNCKMYIYLHYIIVQCTSIYMNHTSEYDDYSIRSVVSPSLTIMYQSVREEENSWVKNGYNTG